MTWFSNYRARRQMFDDYHQARAAIQTGEIWTRTYIGPDEQGRLVTELISGPARAHDDQIEFAGYAVGQPYTPIPWYVGLLAHQTIRLERGSSPFQDALRRGTRDDRALADIPAGIRVGIQYTDPELRGYRCYIEGVLGPARAHGNLIGRRVGSSIIWADEVVTLSVLTSSGVPA